MMTLWHELVLAYFGLESLSSGLATMKNDHQKRDISAKANLH